MSRVGRPSKSTCSLVSDRESSNTHNHTTKRTRRLTDGSRTSGFIHATRQAVSF